MGCGAGIDLNFVVAHSREARPLIDFYRLSKDRHHAGFNVFRNNKTRLVISGQGKINAAAATAYLAGLGTNKETPGLWINVGVCGHPSHSIGSLWRANKITDELSGRKFHPVLIQKSNHGCKPLPGCALMTVEVPTSTYVHQCLYDMEATGFIQTAIRFTSLESIASIKVVSDNLENPASALDKKQMAQLIDPHIGHIDQYLQHLKSLIYIKNNFQPIEIKNIKLTFAQKQIVNELTNSLQVHGSGCDSILSQAKDAGQLIELLREKLKNVELLV